MSKAAAKELKDRYADNVLKEIWRIKDELSASYGHDVGRLFSEARERQKKSGRRVVSFQDSPVETHYTLRDQPRKKKEK